MKMMAVSAIAQSGAVMSDILEASDWLTVSFQIYPIILKAHAGATVFRYCCVNFAIVG